MFRDIFGCDMVSATGLWVEAKDAAQHPIMNHPTLQSIIQHKMLTVPRWRAPGVDAGFL